MSDALPNDTDLLISLYLDGDIEEQDFRRLDAWLKEDREHVAHFVDRVADHCRTSELVSGEFNLPFLSPESEHIFQDASEADDGLPAIQYTTHDKLSKQKYLSAMSYVVRHTFTLKRVAWMTTAAALLLGTVLAVVLFSNPDENEQVAEVSNQPAPDLSTPDLIGPRDDAVTVDFVASITAEHNAQWSGTAPRLDQPLLAGQTLSLTSGFAEVTTVQGAQAILEAPATVEVLDNALRLHVGKLVGKITTPEAKGFTVYTPNMRVVDIGTEFGVSTDLESGTQVHVFEGEVLVAPVMRSEGISRAVVLREFQAVQLDRQQDEVAAIDFEPKRFERRIVKQLNLVDLIAGGDGSGALRGVGLYPMTGAYVSNPLEDSIKMSFSSDAQAHLVPGSSLVARTFVPSKSREMLGLPDGLNLDGMAPSSGVGYGLIWCGGPIPNTHPSWIAEIPLTLSGRALSETGDTVIMHANAGLVLDLDAIGKRYPGFRVSGLKARIANTAGRVQAGDAKDYQAVFQVFADSQIAFQADFKRSLPIDQHIQDIDLPLKAGGRYLTLISTDGGDGTIFRDWLVLTDPVLELTTD